MTTIERQESSATKPSAAQQKVLKVAAADTRGVFRPEEKGGKHPGLSRTLDALVRQGLLRSTDDGADRPGSCGMDKGLRITAAGLRAIGMPDLILGGGQGPVAPAAAEPVGAATKTELILGMLKRPKGASIPEIGAATSWQSHSVRGFLSGTVRKKLGLTVTSEKDGSGTRRYRIGS